MAVHGAVRKIIILCVGINNNRGRSQIVDFVFSEMHKSMI